jgi:arylsulfatase A-like enzyme
MVRWPGHIKPGEVTTEMFSGLDWFPTLLAAAGDNTIKDRLLQGTDIGGTTFKVHSTAITSSLISQAKLQKVRTASSLISTTTAI